MLKSLTLKNFTAFKQAQVAFVPNSERHRRRKRNRQDAHPEGSLLGTACQCEGEQGARIAEPNQRHLQTVIANKLNGVFQPDELGRLARVTARATAMRSELSIFAEPKST